MATGGQRFAAETVAELMPNWASDESNDDFEDGLSNYDDADAEQVLEVQSDETEDDSENDEREYSNEDLQMTSWRLEPNSQLTILFFNM